MQAAVIVFPGSNCDRDAQTALERITGTAPHMVWHGDAELPKVDLIVLPGGFSYGDYLRCGAIAAHSPVVKEVVARAKSGVPTLGICNGFHVLTESGLLPGILMRNAHLRFACKWVDLRVEDSQSIFTCGYEQGQRIRVPIAHGDGNYFADAETLDRIEAEGRVAFRYIDADGAATAAGNPNGSQRNIAGLFNASRTVLGMMPHPERAADPLLGGEDGRRLFEGLVQALS
ncbi:MAG: phosphoribosylformylglycinamidine synthase subunit PurQ [Alphaproteobacteria bacterium]